MFRFRSSFLFVFVLVVLVLATSTYAMVAAEMDRRAGETKGALAKFSISNITYTFDSTNLSQVTRVEFDLEHPVTNIKVCLTGDGRLQKCTSAAPFTHWVCNLDNVFVTTVRPNMHLVVDQP